MTVRLTCNDRGFAHAQNNEGLIMTVECSHEIYDKFMNYVEKMYPGVCKFDYK